MTDDEVLEIFERAFRDVPRPDRVNNCPCPECVALDQQLQRRDNATLQASDLGLSACLLSPESLRYFMPGLIRLSLQADEMEAGETEAGDLCGDFLFSMLGQPISQKEPPRRHPQMPDLTREQTAAVLMFLEHIAAAWYRPSEEIPKELVRAFRNWKHFLAAFDSECPSTE